MKERNDEKRKKEKRKNGKKASHSTWMWTVNCEETSLHTIGVAEEPRTESVKLAKATIRK